MKCKACSGRDTSSWVIVRTELQSSAPSEEALGALARGVASAARRPTLAGALYELAEAARLVSAADLALVRVPIAEELETVAVAGPAALAAELEGTHLPAGDLPQSTLTELADAPPGVRHAAARAGAEFVLVIPVCTDADAGTLELYRTAAPFTTGERFAAELAAGQAALVLRVFESGERTEDERSRSALELAGEALAAALGESHSASEIVRVAATVAGAAVGLLWEQAAGSIELAGSFGLAEGADLGPARELARQALEESGPLSIVPAERLPGGCVVSTSLPLGQPPAGVLQLLFGPGTAPDAAELGRLATFGVRAAHALRASERARSLALELDRTRALLAVVGQATAELSLAYTLETALERVAELLAVDAVAVYLLAEEDRLVAAATRGLTGPHARVAERLLELAPRGSALVDSGDVSRDRRLRAVRDVRPAGLVERQLLRERARDLVQRAQAARRLALGGERGLALAAELGRLLVELRVLHRDGELPGERAEQRRFVVGRTTTEHRIDREQADHLAPDEQRNRECRRDTGLVRGVAYG